MFTKAAQHIAQALALVFTSVVAPVAVAIIVHDLKGDDAAKNPIEQSAAWKEELPRSSGPVPAPGHISIQPAVLISLKIQGTGRTADEALQQALRTALYEVVVTDFGASCWAQRGQAIFEEAWRNPGGIVRTWKTLAVTMASDQGAQQYHATAAIEVDRQTLLARLGAGPQR
jgi:hypothetical protein